MFVSMHQPDYLPWLGYFNKIAISDHFIFFDTADFSKRGFHERNKIKTNTGWTYLTIPISHQHLFTPLKDVILPEQAMWARKHWRSLECCYRRAPYWSKHSDFFENLYLNISSHKTLSDLNIEIITYMSEAFGLSAKLSRASDYKTDPSLKSTESILAVIKKVRATEFLAGPSGKKYLIKERFEEENIKLLFQEFHPKEYSQLYPPFISGLSAVDLLFNEGPNSIKYLNDKS